MTQSGTKIQNRIAGALILIAVAMNWRIITLFGSIGRGGWATVAAILAFAVLGLSLISAVGIVRAQRWGFVAAYPLIVVGTLFFSISYVPIVPRILPVSMRIAGTIALNVLFLVFVAWLHRTTTQPADIR